MFNKVVWCGRSLIAAAELIWDPGSLGELSINGTTPTLRIYASHVPSFAKNWAIKRTIRYYVHVLEDLPLTLQLESY